MIDCAMQPQRLIAIFSLVILMNAMIPRTASETSTLDSEPVTKALQDIDSFPEEDNENSDANLKFMPPESGAELLNFRVAYTKLADNFFDSFVPEVLTPPPLS